MNFLSALNSLLLRILVGQIYSIPEYSFLFHRVSFHLLLFLFFISLQLFSDETYHKLLAFGTEHGTFDGGDQGLLNLYFSNWRELDASHRLPFIYNVTSGSIYSYKAAYQLFGGQVKIVHFLGTVKPWHRSGVHGHQNEHWFYWQQIFNEDVVINLPKGLVCHFFMCDYLDLKVIRLKIRLFEIKLIVFFPILF